MDVDVQAVCTLHSLLKVANALKEERFVSGVKNLFHNYGTQGKGSARMVSSNGFLSLAFGANIAPHLVSGVQVLQCVESSLGGRSKSPEPVGVISGLFFDDFVECIARLAVHIFPGVPPEQMAELMMLQLDQATNCLTRQGKIFHNSNNSAKSRVTPDPPAATGEKRTVRQDHSKQYSATLRDTAKMEASTIPGVMSPGEQPISASSATSPRVGPPQQRRPQTQAKREQRGKDRFLERMEKDLRNREEKLRRLREASIPKADIPQRKPEEQKVASDRLYLSRKHHFERHKTKYEKLRNCDPVTGQPFFQPALLTKDNQFSHRNPWNQRCTICHHGPTSSGSSSSSSTCSSSSAPSCASLSESSATDSVLQDAKSESDKGRETNRFDQLYRQALESRKADYDMRQLRSLEAVQAANAPKASDRSRYYFESRLLRELSSAYLQANHTSALAMSTDSCKQLLLKLIGSKSEKCATFKEDSALVDRLVEFLDFEGSGTVTFVSYMNFVKRVVQEDPCIEKTAVEKSNSGMLPTGLTEEQDSVTDSDAPSTWADDYGIEWSALISQFRQKYLAQRHALDAAKRLERKPEELSFSPRLCPKSRKLDSARLEKSGTKEPRENLLLKHWANIQQSVKEKRELVKDRELEGCTFKPEIHDYKKPPPTPVRLSKSQLQYQKQLHEREEEEKHEEERKKQHQEQAMTPKSTHKRRNSSVSLTGSVASVSTVSSAARARTPLTPTSRLNKPSYASDKELGATSYDPDNTQDGKSNNKRSSREESTFDFSEWQENLERDGSKKSQKEFDDDDDVVVETKTDSETLYSLEGSQTDQIFEEESWDDEQLLLYVDVQVKGRVERIPIYAHDDLRKVAARFAAIHGISAKLETALYEHLGHLVQDHASGHDCST